MSDIHLPLSIPQTPVDRGARRIAAALIRLGRIYKTRAGVTITQPTFLCSFFVGVQCVATRSLSFGALKRVIRFSSVVMVRPDISEALTLVLVSRGTLTACPNRV